MFWNIVAYSVLLVGALMLAADTGIRQSRELSERAPQFVQGKFWGFTPLVLIAIAGLIWVGKAIDYKFSGAEFPRPRSEVTQIAPALPTIAPYGCPRPSRMNPHKRSHLPVRSLQ
jgi:hypothetical protein